MQTILLMDIVIAGFGVYLAFQAVGMKASGKISTSSIVSSIVTVRLQSFCNENSSFLFGLWNFPRIVLFQGQAARLFAGSRLPKSTARPLVSASRQVDNPITRSGASASSRLWTAVC